MRRWILAVAVGALAIPAVAQAGEWYESLKIKGDVRQRHELIRKEDAEDNNRWRIRARLSIEAAPSASWSGAIGVASGSDDPVSTNQTLTDGFSTKGFLLDLAYFDFHPTSVEGLKIVGGKMKLPFETADKTELVWDSDLNPEGLAIQYIRPVGERVKLFANGAGLYIRDSDPDDEAYLGAIQAGLNVKASEDVKLMIGAGYFDYEGARGMPGFYKPTKFYGNSTVEIGEDDGDPVYGYAADFNEVEVLGAVDVAVNETTTLKLYGDYVTNLEADELASGWLFGGAASRGKDRGALKVYANYRQLEADAVIGAFTDSDFIGGGTNGKGVEMGAAVGLAKNASLDLTYFVNTKGIKDTEAGADYRRLQADVQLKF